MTPREYAELKRATLAIVSDGLETHIDSQRLRVEAARTPQESRSELDELRRLVDLRDPHRVADIERSRGIR